MTETPTIKAPKTEKKQVKANQPLQQDVSSMQWDMPRHLNGPINYQWGGTMDGVQNMGGVHVMNFVPVRIAEKNLKGETVYREVRMSHQQAAEHAKQKTQEQKQPPVETAKVAVPEKKIENQTTGTEKKEDHKTNVAESTGTGGISHNTVSTSKQPDTKTNETATKPVTSKTVKT